MPALPPFAPWIKAPDETGNFATGSQIAMQAAAHRAKQEEFAQEMELQKQAQKERTLMAQQKLDIDRQYNQQQQALNQQRAAAAKQASDMKMQQFLQQAAARQAIAAGVQKDPTQAAQLYQQYGPAAFGSAGGFGTALNAINKANAPAPQTTWVPPDPTTQAPGYVKDPRGAPHFPPTPKAALTQEQKDALAERTVDASIVTAKIKKINSDLELAEAKGSKKEIDQLNTELMKALKEKKDLFHKSSGSASKSLVINPDTGAYEWQEGGGAGGNIPDFMKEINLPLDPAAAKPGDIQPIVPPDQSAQPDMPMARAALPFGM